MIYITWKTNDYRGRRTWRALWSNVNTDELRLDAWHYIRQFELMDAAIVVV
jgi:hypothetical protein